MPADTGLPVAHLTSCSEFNVKEVVTAYCSWCYQKGEHQRHRSHWVAKNEYVCRRCKKFTVECSACDEMAKGRLTENQIEELENDHGTGIRTWINKRIGNWSNFFCAQHDGTVPDFDAISKKASRLSQYVGLLEAKHRNYQKIGQITAGTLSTAGIVALTATTGGGVPALAAALGKLGLLGTAGTGTAISTLSGAALTSASLAAIGGTVAVGTIILTAAGTGLGGALGAILAKRYVGEDKYFGIHCKNSGKSGKTVFVNGFLQQREDDFEDWLDGHLACFPQERLYGLTWASKDLYELGRILGSGVFSEAAKQMLIRIGKKGTKKFNPLGPLVTILGLAGNPWHVAMVRAAKTGAVLADAICRTRERRFTLVGHSLGCRVIFYALQALSLKPGAKKVDDVILLGGAVGKDDERGWGIAAKTINGQIANCYSENDGVLSKLYRIANANLSHPIGISPIPLQGRQIQNLDCSRFIFGAGSHMSWKDHYEKILRMIY